VSDDLTLDFGRDVAAFAAKTNRSIAEAHRLVSIKLFSSIIQDTPVDTGEAVGGWIPSMGEPVNGKSGRLGPIPEGELAAAVRALPSKVAYLSNSVGHIDLLEYGTASYGFSPKAPEGMVRRNIVRFRQLFHEAWLEAQQEPKKS